MIPATSRSQTLKELIALEERRAGLQGQLNIIDQRVAALRNAIFTGSAAAPKANPPGRPPGKGRIGGTYREFIMAALEAAGSVGVRVKDIAMAMKTKPVNVHSWFHANLKRIPSIKKLTGGHYRLAGGGAPKAAALPAAPPRGKRRKGAKRGALSAAIMENLKAAGASGIKIGDLADKLGAKYKNVYIWFATTGKKNAKIKRIAPATYRLFN